MLQDIVEKLLVTEEKSKGEDYWKKKRTWLLDDLKKYPPQGFGSTTGFAWDVHEALRTGALS